MNGDTQTVAEFDEPPVQHRRRKSDYVVVPPWVWALAVSLILQIVGAAYVTGQVTEKLEGVSTRVQRLETQMDRYFGAKP